MARLQQLEMSLGKLFNAPAKKKADLYRRQREEAKRLALHEAGDEDAARQRLTDAGIQDEGIAHYMQSWKS